MDADADVAKAVDSRLCICNYICMYAIRYAASVELDLRELSAYYQRIILSAIETHLTHEPMAPSRRRKPLPNLTPSWAAERLMWELRVREYRVFYDVSEPEQIVMVRAIRHKSPEQRTEDLL
jgi:mRNA-degrading endonuclease RelE of RelBE toxin-antitoxin system